MSNHESSSGNSSWDEFWEWITSFQNDNLRENPPPEQIHLFDPTGKATEEREMLLINLSLGALMPDEADDIVHHVADCPHCREHLREYVEFMDDTSN